ncbi:BioY family biotin transporter [Candidatus Trichorickettsia mobilis]|uniref:Biotin transporter n=1 Tax=Candidatus Trichorickettsia mobilis TaxID=1346319 RepID=A0ABZ0UUC5_9RICK|nr:biotin transporter BioY [Candidatus Trichorickettsia mobilis]WPY00489.1 BioY family biotin transporter [Candidatus Trichorickettsia mobilis]
MRELLNYYSNDCNLLFKKYASLLQIIFGVLALAASSQLSIPLKPVPITFLTMMISLIGLIYKPYLAFTTVGIYLICGVCGLPVFSKYNYGIEYVMGTTGGYLIGCMIAAPIMSILKNRPLLKLASKRGFEGDTAAWSTAYFWFVSDSSTAPKYKSSAEVEFQKRSNNISQKFWPVAFCCFIGHIIIYFFGITWLSQFMSFNNAIYNGFIVFIPSGIVKILIFSYLFSYIKSKVQI